MKNWLSRTHATTEPDRTAALIQGIIERGRTRLTLDDRPEDEILGYDENGLPL